MRYVTEWFTQHDGFTIWTDEFYVTAADLQQHCAIIFVACNLLPNIWNTSLLG
jgi:hypothetical protein